MGFRFIRKKKTRVLPWSCFALLCVVAADQRARADDLDQAGPHERRKGVLGRVHQGEGGAEIYGKVFLGAPRLIFGGILFGSMIQYSSTKFFSGGSVFESTAEIFWDIFFFFFL